MRKYIIYILVLLPLLHLNAQGTRSEVQNMQEYGMGAPNQNHQHMFHGRKASHSGLFGSGGMNYRYNTRTGLYHGLRNMRKDLLGLWMDGSYSGLYSNIPLARTMPGGGSCSFGLAYEYDHYGKFFLQTGVGIRAQKVYNDVGDVLVVNDNVYDKMGYRYTLFTDYHERRDCSEMVYMQIPLLVGTYAGPMYFAGGVKLQVAHWGRTSTQMLGTTTGVYEQYFGLGAGNIFQEMDNHGLQQRVPISRGGMDRLQLKWDVLLSGEIGYEYGKRIYSPSLPRWDEWDTRVRFALFADWGMININPNTQQPLYDIPAANKWDFPAHQFAHVFSSKETDGRHVHNFFVGIKITLLFGFPWQQVCYICGPYHSELEYR